MTVNMLASESTLPAPVLLVEDEPLICRRLEGLLLQLGYAPEALVFAATLAQARACLATEPIALALVDLGLPDGNGTDLIAEMHAADPGLAILVISAWSTEDAILAALRAGATGYVLKERDDLEVSLSIRSVLRAGRPSTPSSPGASSKNCAPGRRGRPKAPPAKPSARVKARSCAWCPRGWATARSPRRCSCRVTPWNATSSTSTASSPFLRAPARYTPRARGACSIEVAGGSVAGLLAGARMGAAGRARLHGAGALLHVAKGDADGARPQAGPWQAVTLPDDWSARWPGYGGTAWYRIDWRKDCPEGRAGQVALVLESVVMAGEVYVNDERIWRDRHLTEPLSRSWNMPRYWLIPDSLVREGVNTLWVRVVGVAGQSPGLGPVYLGDPLSSLQRYENLWWSHRTLFTLNLIVSAVLGGLCFCIWLMRREQRTYGWYALMALFWVLFIANVLVVTPWPFADSATSARANIMALVLYVACFCIFTWRFGEQCLPRTEKALWVLTAALLALIAFVPRPYQADAQLAAVLVVSAIFFANCLQFPFHAWRTRRPEHGMLAACLLVFFAASAHDLLRILKLIDSDSSHTPFTSVVVTLCMSAVLGLRHAHSVRRIESFNQELADGIEQARTELATTLEREHTLALANARLQDRLQIAHDLHDGLGGSLVRMMAMVEQDNVPVQRPQFLSMLKLLRDDLRQTIDSGSSAGIKVPASPREWIAPLRHRFMQLFDELDIHAAWRFPRAMAHAAQRPAMPGADPPGRRIAGERAPSTAARGAWSWSCASPSRACWS